MPEMRISVLAPYLSALHEEAPVFLLHNIIWLKWLRKAWPACAGFEFVERAEERLTGDNVNVYALPMIIRVFVVEGRFRAFPLRYIILRRRQHFLRVASSVF